MPFVLGLAPFSPCSCIAPLRNGNRQYHRQQDEDGGTTNIQAATARNGKHNSIIGNEIAVRSILRQVLRQLDALHNSPRNGNHYVHGGVSASNILIHFPVFFERMRGNAVNTLRLLGSHVREQYTCASKRKYPFGGKGIEAQDERTRQFGLSEELRFV